MTQHVGSTAREPSDWSPEESADVAPADLELGHMSQAQVIGLTASSMQPACGLATVPAFVMPFAGMSSWLAMVTVAAIMVGIGLFVNVFARRFVGTGSLYSYIGHVFGRWSRVVMAAALVPGYIVALACLALSFGLYAGSCLVSIGIESASGKLWQYGLCIGTTLITAAVCYRGLDISVRVCVLLTVLSVPAVVVIILGTLFTGDLDLGAQVRLEGFTFAGFAQGVAIGMSFLIGFESCAAMAAETRNPKTVIPRALLSVLVVLVVIYTLATVIQVPTLLSSADELATGMSPTAVLAHHSGLGVLAQVTDLLLATAAFASFVGFANFGSRVVVSTAGDKLLPAGLMRIHPRFKSPTAAIVFILAPALAGPLLLLAVTETTPLNLYGYMATLYVYCWVVPYVLVCLGGAILLIRSGTRGAVVIAAAATLISMIVFWLFVNGIITTQPAPLNAMPYVMLVTLAIFGTAFGVSARRHWR